MKKIIQIITGMCMATLLIIIGNTADGAISQSDFEDQLMIRDIRWSDIFGPRKNGLDLYKLVYSNLFINPQKVATSESARKFGLTTSEIEKIAGGSVSALANNPSKNYNDNSYSRLVAEYSAIVDYYAETLEINTLKEEMNAIALPNEIFSNGLLSDSGFDLVDDSRRMQKILFNKESKTTSGNRFSGEASSANIDAYDNTPAVLEFSDSISAPTSTSTGVSRNASNNPDLESGNELSEINSGESANELEEKIEVSENDICIDEEEGSLNDVFKVYEEEEKIALELKESFESETDSSSENDLENEDTINDENENYELFSPDGSINPAPGGKWGGSFCPSIVPSASVNEDGYKAIMGSSGFESLAFAKESFLNNTLAAGAGAVLGGENISLKVAICFSTELIYKTYSTYMPKDSCIKCEVDRINESLSELLSHSLVPNKVSGNYMESAKCKDAFSLVPSMNIIAVPSPISTPMNYDLISEKNIFEEWNDFVAEYQPFLSDAGKIPGDFESSFILENSPIGQTLDMVMIEINRIQADNLAKAFEETSRMDYSKELKDKNLYAKSLFVQIEQMNNIFKSIQNLIQKMDENACKLILKKPSI